VIIPLVEHLQCPICEGDDCITLMEATNRNLPGCWSIRVTLKFRCQGCRDFFDVTFGNTDRANERSHGGVMVSRRTHSGAPIS
jgi:hypothetical protein